MDNCPSRQVSGQVPGRFQGGLGALENGLDAGESRPFAGPMGHALSAEAAGHEKAPLPWLGRAGPGCGRCSGGASRAEQISLQDFADELGKLPTAPVNTA